MSEDIESAMSRATLVEVSCKGDGGGEDVRIPRAALLDLVTNALLSPKLMAEGLSLPNFAAQLALQGAEE